METLGFDSIVEISSYLTPADILELSLTCKALDLLNNNSVWTALFTRRFPLKFNHSNSKQDYIKALNNYCHVNGSELVITWGNPRDEEQYWTRGPGLDSVSGHVASLRCLCLMRYVFWFDVCATFMVENKVQVYIRMRTGQMFRANHVNATFRISCEEAGIEQFIPLRQVQEYGDLEAGDFRVVMLPVVNVGTRRKPLSVSLQDHSGHVKSEFAVDYIAVRPILVEGDLEVSEECIRLQSSKGIPNLSNLSPIE